MTTAVRVAAVLLTALVLHTAVFPSFRIFGVTAEVMLLVAVGAGMAAGPERGVVVAFVAGLLADCFLSTPFGLSALVYSVVGWAVGAFHQAVLPSARWIVMLTGSLATGAGVVLYAVLGAVIGERHLLSSRLALVVAVVAVVGGLLTPATIAVLRWAMSVRRPSDLALL